MFLHEALDDGEPQTPALAAITGGIIELVKFLEDTVDPLLRYADPRVPDLNAQVRAATPTAYQYLAALRIADRVGKEVADNVFQQYRIAVYDGG